MRNSAFVTTIYLYLYEVPLLSLPTSGLVTCAVSSVLTIHRFSSPYKFVGVKIMNKVRRYGYTG